MSKEQVGNDVILGHIPPRLQPAWLKIPLEMRQYYAHQVLGTMQRGQQSHLYPENIGYSDTNLTHTESLLDAVTYVEEKYPRLAKEVDLDEDRIELLVHDGGEGLTKIDLPMAGPARNTPAARRVRKLETRAFTQFLRRIPDPDTRRAALGSYARITAPDADERGDLEALMGHYLDKRDSVSIGGLYILGAYQRRGETAPRPALADHVMETAQIMVTPATALRPFLSHMAQYELDDLVNEDLSRISSLGYTSQAENALEYYTGGNRKHPTKLPVAS